MKKAILFAMLLAMAIFPTLVQARHFARWHTSMGTFTAEIYDEIMPITGNNFIDLTNSGFYNNLIFHRVVAGFVIQDGCPYGTGYGGPGYTIPDETSPLLHHDQAGILAMAKTSAPNSAGSQYYFTLAPAPHLDGNYAIFGKVIEGLDVVLAIGQVPVDANSHPLTPVHIWTLRMLDLNVASVFPDPAEEINITSGEPLMFMIEAYTEASQLSFNWYIDDVLQSAAQDFIFEPAITAAGTHSVRCNIASSDSIAHNVGWTVNVSSANLDESIPQPSLGKLTVHPNPFSESLAIELSSAKSTPVSLQIFNQKGRKVRTLTLNGEGSGLKRNTWDGLDDSGRSCAAGVYYFKAETSEGSAAAKAVLLK